MRRGSLAIGIMAALCLGVPARAQEPDGLSLSTLDFYLFFPARLERQAMRSVADKADAIGRMTG